MPHWVVSLICQLLEFPQPLSSPNLLPYPKSEDRLWFPVKSEEMWIFTAFANYLEIEVMSLVFN